MTAPSYQGYKKDLNQLHLEFHCSPSQVSTYELCARKWAWRYIDGIYGPPNKYADFGIKTHKHLEKWLKKRLPPSGDDPARVAQIMIPHLPASQLVDPRNVEHETTLMLDDIYFDLALDLFLPIDPPRVYDHKTTSSFDWALTPAAMSDDVQATMYAAWAFVRTGADRVHVQWTYGRRSPPDAKTVSRGLTREDIQDRLLRTLGSAREMRLIMRSGLTAIDVPYDAAGCQAFGGCPYIDKCNLTPAEKMESYMAQGTAREALLAKLKAKNGASPGQVNPPEATQAAAPSGGSKLQQKLAAKKAAAAAPVVEPEPEAVEEEAEQAEEAPKRGRPRGSKNAPTQVNPGEQWLACYGAAMSSVGSDLLLDAEVRGEICGEVAAVADEMLKQYQSRYGG